MSVKERILTIILLDKMRNEPKYAEKIGLEIIKKDKGSVIYETETNIDGRLKSK